MSPRTGRPSTQETARKEKLNIRLTHQEKEEIQQCADVLNITRTDVILKGVRLVKEGLEKK